jgi:uncharacterized RDD family membrane protein YckC
MADSLCNEGKAYVTLVGLGTRFVGYFIIDGIVVFGFSSALAVIIGAAILSNETGYSEAEEKSTYVAVWYLTYIVVATIYFLTSNMVGCSIGKLILGIRIVREDGTRPGVGWGIVRTFGLFLSSLFFGLPYLFALTNERSQAPHDMLAGTLVIEKGSYAVPGSPLAGYTKDFKEPSNALEWFRLVTLYEKAGRLDDMNYARRKGAAAWRSRAGIPADVETEHEVMPSGQADTVRDRPEARFCPGCGTELASLSRFCPYCGVRLQPG